MSRLIDADKLLETLKTEPQYLMEAPRSCKSLLTNIISNHHKKVIEVIEKQPTAYDIDNVVEQLEEARQFIANKDYCKQINSNEDCNDRDCFLCCADYLIKIVKAGGLDES